MGAADADRPRDAAQARPDGPLPRPAVSTRVVRASPEHVWGVLADGWAYERWVVGARKIRHVDPAWPAPGARFHHEIGVGPAHLDDSTEVIEASPGERIVLAVRFRPAGTGIVGIDLASPSAGRTSITMSEQPRSGPARRAAPWTTMALRVRNAVALRRLGRIVEARARLAER